MPIIRINSEPVKPKTWEQVLEECLKELTVHEDAVWIPTKGNRVQVYFSVNLYDNDNTLNYLNSMGFGMKKGTAGKRFMHEKYSNSSCFANQ